MVVGASQGGNGVSKGIQGTKRCSVFMECLLCAEHVRVPQRDIKDDEIGEGEPCTGGCLRPERSQKPKGFWEVDLVLETGKWGN